MTKYKKYRIGRHNKTNNNHALLSLCCVHETEIYVTTEGKTILATEVKTIMMMFKKNASDTGIPNKVTLS